MKAKLNYEKGREGYLFLMKAQEPGSGKQPHTHEELELNLVVSGRASYKLDDRRYELKRDSLVWLFPGQDHVLVDYDAGFEMWVLVFSRECVERRCSGDAAVLKEERPEGSFCGRLAAPGSKELQELFARVEGLAGASEGAFNAGLEFALALSWEAFKSAAAIKASEELHPAVEKAAALLDKGRRELKIEELAKRCGLSASRLSRLFNKQLGVSMPQYKNRARMRAFNGLAGEEASLTEAAYKAGFGSYVQFHRVFKRLNGSLSPSAAKRKAAGGSRGAAGGRSV